MSHGRYDETVGPLLFAPAAPAVIWGALMTVALVGAGSTVLRSNQIGGGERLVAAAGDPALRRDLARLTAERDEIAGRVTALERGFAEMKLAASAASAPETTGSIARPASPAAETEAYGLSLGPNASLEAIRRRWAALSARHPQELARLAPRARRSSEAPGALDLVAGPFATRADADRLCAALAEQGLACDTTPYAGDPIGRP